MTLVKKSIGRVPQSFGNWSASFVNPKTQLAGYGKKFRASLYGCEFESLMENNTYAPMTWDGAETFTEDTVHWRRVTGSPEAWLAGQDKSYEPENFSGMGRVVLKKHLVEVEEEVEGETVTVTKNLLYQDDFYKDDPDNPGQRIPNTNTVFVIKHDFTLGEDITVPENCMLKFEGSSLDNGTIVGNHTNISADPVTIFKDNVIIDGIWDIDDIYDSWFEYTFVEGVAKNQVITNILALTHDDYSSNVHFDRDTEYLVELERFDICDVDPGWATKAGSDNGTRQNVAHWAAKYDNWDLIYCNPMRSKLTMFTIPSNTNVTMNSTVRMLPTPQGAYFMFYQRGKENITIEGNGAFIGDCYGDGTRHLYDLKEIVNGKLFNYQYGDGTGAGGEWGFVLKFDGCKNIIMKDITVRGSFGDCVDLEPLYTGDADVPASSGATLDFIEPAIQTDGVLMDNMKLLYGRRNTVACAAQNITIRNCYFKGAANLGIETYTHKTFQKGQAVKHNGNAYVCIEDIITPEEFTLSKWKLKIGENDIEQYDSSKIYTTGMYSKYDGQVWQVKDGQTTTGAFDKTKWSKKVTPAASLTGTAPAAAIDFECDILNDNLIHGHAPYLYTGNKNVVMESCVFEDNKYDMSCSSPVPNINEDGSDFLGDGVTIRNCRMNMLRMNGSIVFHHVSPARNNLGKNIIFEECDIYGITSAENSMAAWYESAGTVRFTKCRLRNLWPYMQNERYDVGYIFEDCTFDNGVLLDNCINLSSRGTGTPHAVIRVTNNDNRWHVIALKGWIIINNLIRVYVDGKLYDINQPYAVVSARPSGINRNDSEYYRVDVYPIYEADGDFKWLVTPKLDPGIQVTSIKYFLTVELVKSGYLYEGGKIDLVDSEGNIVDTTTRITCDYDTVLPQEKVKNQVIAANPSATAKEINDAINNVYRTFITYKRNDDNHPESATYHFSDLTPNDNVDADKNIIVRNVNINSYSISHEDVDVPAEAGNLALVGTMDILSADHKGAPDIYAAWLFLTGNNTKYKIQLNDHYTSYYQIAKILSGEWNVQDKLIFYQGYGPLIVYNNVLYNIDGSLFINTKVVFNSEDFATWAAYGGTLVVCVPIDLEGNTVNVEANKVMFSGNGGISNGTLNFTNDVLLCDGWNARITADITIAARHKCKNFGTSSDRPSDVNIGFRYFDTTLGKPIWWNGTAWVDATGTTV